MRLNKEVLRKAVQQIVESDLREVQALASSKVLITGAYLIIDPKNEGMVLSTDARFMTRVKPMSESQLSILNTTESQIRVFSP